MSFIFRKKTPAGSSPILCGTSSLEVAQSMFDEMPQRVAFSWATMIDGYGKQVGSVDRARELFDQMSARDLVCWNSMIDG
jgi:pentatricopeptide repeat protein